MKTVLFVEDLPKLKLSILLYWLEEKGVRFKYEIVGSIKDAACYLNRGNNNVDLVITDLGLPIFTGEYVTNLLQGMDLVRDMDRLNPKVPVIINSSTVVPNFEIDKEEYDERGQELYKVDDIMEMKEWIFNFLAN